MHGDNNNNNNDNNGEDGEYPITFCANYNTMKCEIRCAYRINFGKSNSIGDTLFLIEAYTATAKITRIGMSINIMNVNVIRIV